MGHYIRCFNDDGKECYGYIDNSNDIVHPSSGMDDCDENIARLEELEEAESPGEMIFQKDMERQAEEEDERLELFNAKMCAWSQDEENFCAQYEKCVGCPFE